MWADSTRLPSVQAYQKSHPDVKMKIVTYDGGADGSAYLQSKVQLFDRTGSGWPDVVFGTPTDVTWASKATKPGVQPFAAPLDEKLVPKNTLDGFAKGSLTPCQFGGHTYCMRNDIAQVLLWYNKPLMDKWGYKVPTTWQEYEALGKQVAKDHPGYLVGSVGDTNSHESYFWSGQCPAFSLVKPDTLRTDLRDPKCTRMAKLLDNLISAKAIATQGFFSQGFAKNSGSKVLMAYGPSWYGQYLFKAGFKTPAKQIAAAPPLAWKGESTTATGNVGGGVWMVSSHSANLKASTDLVTWLTTSDENQATAPTYPAYTQAAKAWLANPANRNYFANDVSEPFEQAANEVDRLVEHQVLGLHRLVQRRPPGSDLRKEPDRHAAGLAAGDRRRGQDPGLQGGRSVTLLETERVAVSPCAAAPRRGARAAVARDTSSSPATRCCCSHSASSPPGTRSTSRSPMTGASSPGSTSS